MLAQRTSRVMVSSMVVAARRVPVAMVPVRALRTSVASQSDEFRKKESTHETEYASREERRVLKEMLSRLEKQADPDNKRAHQQLDELFRKHGVKGSFQLAEDLIAWKHSH